MTSPHFFADRILRKALSDPDNLHDLLTLALGDAVEQFDFAAAEYLDPGFRLPDLREQRADVLCRAPLRGDAGQSALVCVLLEHQLGPDPLMPLRMHEYALAYWRRESKQPRSTWQSNRLPAVLPVVFHTGLKPWTGRRLLADLIVPTAIAPAPVWPIRYIELYDFEIDTLLRSHHPWLNVLAVARAEWTRPREFREVLTTAIEDIDALADACPHRHLGMLEVMIAWAWARRPDTELDSLKLAVTKELRDDMKQKIDWTGRRHLSLEQVHHIETLKLARNALRTVLRVRFGTIPAELDARIEAREDPDDLWEAHELALKIDSLDELWF